MGGGVRPQSQDPHGVGRRRVSAKKITSGPALRRMERAGRYGVYFIFAKHGTGPTFRCSMPKFPTQDPNHRILRAPAEPLHALLFLHAGRNAGADGDARGLVLPVPDHLLSQRPLLHRTGIEPRARSASARTTTPSWPSPMSRPCKRLPTGSPARSSASGWITGRCCWGRSSPSGSGAR